MAKDQIKFTAFQTAVASKLEQLKNKKNEITGDFTQDNTSYPTVQAVKSFVASVMDGLHAVAKTGSYNDLEDTPVFDFVKQATAEDGFASTYYMTIDGEQVGVKLNLAKDEFLKEASTKTVGATPSEAESNAGLNAGDKYISLIVNTADNDKESELILPANDFINIYNADETTITISNGTFSIKAAGVTSTELADNAVITSKIADENITTAKIADEAVTLAKLDDEVPAKWVADADTECEAYLDALTAAINEL